MGVCKKNAGWCVQNRRSAQTPIWPTGGWVDCCHNSLVIPHAQGAKLEHGIGHSLPLVIGQLLFDGVQEVPPREVGQLKAGGSPRPRVFGVGPPQVFGVPPPGWLASANWLGAGNALDGKQTQKRLSWVGSGHGKAGKGFHASHKYIHRGKVAQHQQKSRSTRQQLVDQIQNFFGQRCGWDGQA